MFRRLHARLALLCTLALLVILTLWARSRRCSDELIVRVASSYVGGPRVKRLVIRTTDGVALSVHLKVIPSVANETPPWRDDVPVNFTVAQVDDESSGVGKATVKPTYRPASPGGRPITPQELSDFEKRAEADFAAEPRLRWTSNRPNRFGGGGGRRHPVLTRLGIRPYHPENYITNNSFWPGAHHEVGAHVPFALAASVAAAAPVSWVPLWLWRRRVARRRLRAGLCPACAYDLRESPGRCPECGRVIAPGEAEAARSRRFVFLLRPFFRGRLRRNRWRAAAFAGLAFAGIFLAGYVVFRGRGTYDPFAAKEARELRAELDAHLSTIAAEEGSKRV